MDDYSKAQLDTLRQKLVDLDRSIANALTPLSAASAAVDLDAPIGRLSRMDAMVNQGIAQKNEKSLKRRQNLIASALKRMNDEDYGECLECGELIAYPRLLAAPEAVYCVACQSAHEQR